MNNISLTLIDVILLAVALGMDCLVVSFSQGLLFDRDRLRISFSLAAVMGIFQGAMPILGYIGADKLYKYVVPHCRWIVFGIFFILGLKFIFEAFSQKMRNYNHIGFLRVIGLGIATSIDALVAGAPIRLTGTELMFPCMVIALASFIMSLIGFWSGNKVRHHCPVCLGISAGVILIILAVKALV